ncbi:MAG TPA: Hsp20/alpha crystallin family protein [Chloroflexota bacterium]|nr:Hsp20/alpha crystallin family protein [Chloroflexota bacterium]
MAMDRWNPFRDMLALREAMDRMFDDNSLRNGFASGRASSFPIDLAESDAGFVLRAALPGLKPEDVQITIHGDTLTVRGESTASEERKEQHWIIREQRSGAFHRMVTLPAPVNPDGAEARFQDGILELTLPKAEQAMPRQIKVSAGGAARPTAPATPAAPTGGTNSTGEAAGDETVPGSAAPSSAGAGTVQPAGDPTTPPDKDTVTQSSEESMGTSDPPSWTQERT